mgnify:CR=1 FL=1
MPIHNHFTFEPNPSNPSQLRPGRSGLSALGPLMQVEVSIPDELAQYFTENNMPIPSPLTGMGLIDTGASITAVDVSIIQQLSIQPVGISNVFTPQGSAQQELFPIKLAFVGTQITINFSSVLGSELINQGIIALLGRDVLSNCILIYNGTAGHFSLSM